MKLLLRSLARNESTTASKNKLLNDIKEIEDEFLNGGYGNFKRAVADAVCDTLEEISIMNRMK